MGVLYTNGWKSMDCTATRTSGPVGGVAQEGGNDTFTGWYIGTVRSDRTSTSPQSFSSEWSNAVQLFIAPLRLHDTSVTIGTLELIRSTCQWCLLCLLVIMAGSVSRWKSWCGRNRGLSKAPGRERSCR